MKWRYPIVLLGVLLVSGTRATGVPQTPPMVLAGQVEIGTGADGRLLLMIDEQAPDQPGDGLVDWVFALQGAPSLGFSGPATVTYIRHRVTVQIGPTAGWVFTVGGHGMPEPDPALTAYGVTGMAQMWGAGVHQTAAALLDTLSSSTCSKLAAQTTSSRIGTSSAQVPGCTNCATGGPGISSCSIDCSGGSSCSADCGDSTHACCSCPNSCTCCAYQGHH